MTFQEIKEKIENDEWNKAYTERGIPPIYQVSEEAKILLIGQAPVKKVEEDMTNTFLHYSKTFISSIFIP
ncbi:MAG: hypothetical protein SPK64_04555 [Candidatus Enterosoma sp.]|nr:hypothetical protein [Candidatus Enterosoma sp.]